MDFKRWGLLFLFFLAGCGKTPFDILLAVDYEETIPKFVERDFVDISKIRRISKFRSGIGHDYSDSFERNRSMKHYYSPLNEYIGTNDKLPLYSPVDGLVVDILEERAGGKQVRIKPKEYSYILFIIFHVNPLIKKGAKVSGRQPIGYANLGPRDGQY